MSTHPEVLWAQRSSSTTAEKNLIYLTVNLPDINESTLEYALTSTSLSFKATAGTANVKSYAFDLKFYGEIDPNQSSSRLTSRSLFVILRKKELKSEYWPRLMHEKSKTPFIKTDFSKWVDEDEQDGNLNVDDELGGFPGMPDMDFSKMMSQDNELGSGLPPVSNETSDSDSDDEGPPALEDVESA